MQLLVPFDVAGYGGPTPPLLYSLLAIAISSLLIYLLYVYYLRPASLRRALLQQGFTVLPYRPIAGDLPELKRLEAQAQLSDIPSPSHHHLLLPHILPFYNNLLSKHAGSRPIFWWGNEPIFVISNADDARSVLAVDVKQMKKPSFGTARFHSLVGKGLLLANGEDWHQQRSILRPAFFSEKLKGMVADMVASTLEMVEAWEGQVISKQGDAAEIEVARDIKNVTADILARTSFGSSYLKGKAVFERQERLLELLSKRILPSAVIPFYSKSSLQYLPTRTNREIKKMEKRNNEELLEIVELRKHDIANEKPGAHSAYRTDLLGLMLAMKEQEDKLDEKQAHLTTQQVIDECKTFFFAGHETTANLLAWTMVLLSLNQEWQDKAREEVLEVFGDKGEPKADHLNKLKIVGMILNESLRLYPPVPQYGRREILSNDDDIVKVGNARLPPGTVVSIASLYIHRDKEVWGEDADEFQPERFANGVSKACKHPYAFMPFGMGPRICIGQHFAIMEAKVILSLILQRFSFHLSPNYRHAPLNTITMRPKHGVQVILRSLSTH